MPVKIFCSFLMIFLLGRLPVFSQNEQEKIPSKEEILQSIMDVNVDEEEAMEILAKYYPELLQPVVEAKKDFEKANTVHNAQETGAFFQNLGQKALDRKDYDQAIIYFQKAIIQKKQSTGGTEIHPEISRSYQGIGEAFTGKKEVEQALEAYQRGIMANASGFDETDLLQNPQIDNIISNQLAIPIFETKGDLLFQSARDENRLLAALIAYERAIDVIELVCRKYTAEESKLNLTEEVVLLTEKAIQAALKLHQISRNPAYKTRAFQLAEKGKAMILTVTLLEKGYTSEVPQDLYRREQQLKIAIAQLEHKIKKNKPRKEKSDPLEDRLFALHQTMYFLQDSLKTYYPQATHLKYVPPRVAVDSLQFFLENTHAALIEYFIGPNASYVFTLTEGVLEIDRLEEIEEINKRIFSFRQLLQSHDFKKNAEQSITNFSAHAGALYSLLVDKTIKHLPGHIEELIIVPDAALWFLPFEILLTDQLKTQQVDFGGGHLPYLLNKYAVSYTHSAKLLLREKNQKAVTEPLSFAGFAPEFTGTGLASRSCLGEDRNLGQLKYNQSELKNIQQYFGGEAFFGDQASRKNFLKVAEKAEIIHCSTHACLNEDDPMGNRIYFAGEEFLSTEDIYNLSIKAKMVVLSACQTGLGRVYNGEGVISLARAFAQAGCPSVTMSLWPVADQATAELMALYYESLDDGLTKSQALRQAKLNYLANQPKAKQHPYYWAAFVHVGDFSPINESKPGDLVYWLCGLGGILLLGWLIGKKRKPDDV